MGRWKEEGNTSENPHRANRRGNADMVELFSPSSLSLNLHATSHITWAFWASVSVTEKLENGEEEL